jgi:hypothetical protein
MAALAPGAGALFARDDGAQRHARLRTLQQLQSKGVAGRGGKGGKKPGWVRHARRGQISSGPARSKHPPMVPTLCHKVLDSFVRFCAPTPSRGTCLLRDTPLSPGLAPDRRARTAARALQRHIRASLPSPISSSREGFVYSLVWNVGVVRRFGRFLTLKSFQTPVTVI